MHSVLYRANSTRLPTSDRDQRSACLQQQPRKEALNIYRSLENNKTTQINCFENSSVFSELK